MSGPDIFISYARHDEEMARLVAGAFIDEGFNVWWDAALHSGETFDEVIEKELRASKAVVVLWSPRSVASRWVRAEATLADRNKTLAPAIIEPCDRPIIFELTHTVDLSSWTGDRNDPAWKAYVKDIQRLVGEQEKGDHSQRSAQQKSMASRPISRPAPRTDAKPEPAAKQSEGLEGANMESLLSAISSLQQAISQSGGQAPAPPLAAPAAASVPRPEPEEDDSEDEATQFYTGSDAFSMIEGDELHCLEISIAGELEKRYVVGPLGLKIGRVAPADVVLADSKVSRSHCMIELKDDLLYVSDLNSTNGTFVDGNRVNGAAVLPVGSTLMVGHFALVHEVRSRAEIQ